MQIAVTLYDRGKQIPVPCRWGEYTVVAIRDVYMNGYYTKLLTLALWKIEGIPPFPLPASHFDDCGRWLFNINIKRER